jgi:Bifunctional DNA primase/polymerase, N-terminal/AAA domain
MSAITAPAEGDLQSHHLAGVVGDVPQTATLQGLHPVDAIYARGAPLYRKGGWRGVLPLPPQEKAPPPTGFTGDDGKWPADEQIGRWIADEPANANLGLRVDYGFVGIDVDAYGDKVGAVTLAEGERQWGPLPLTFRSTARIDDEVSGIRLFKVPLGLVFRDPKFVLDDGSQVGHIDIIQPHHRFIVAWPSWHPKVEARYRWFDDRIHELMPEGSVPSIDEIPELPQAWVEGLSRDAVRDEVFDDSAPDRSRKGRDDFDEHRYRKLIALEDEREPEPVVKERLDRAIAELDSDCSSRHDTARDHVAALMRFQAIGRAGVPRALNELCLFYVLQVADSRPMDVAQAEFERLVEGAAALVAGSMPSDPVGETGTAAAASTDGDEGHTGVKDDGPSWCPIDLTDLIKGVREPLLPSLFERSDGQCLLYPGLVHSFHGESESGKSLIIQIECVRLINRGQKVLYLDFESDVGSVVDRLLDFGADPVAVADHFHYIQPEARPDSATERRAWEDMLSNSYALAVIDGVTDALGIFGCSTIDNDDVAGWIRTVPKQIAARTGAAVVLVDHVTKDASSRNRFAIGGQAKMAGLTGAAYTVEVVKPLGRGMRGEVVLRIGKDRPGSVRPHCGSFHRNDRTQEAAYIVVDSTGESPIVTIAAPGIEGSQDSNGKGGFRPTTLMERVSEVIEQHPGELTKNKVAEKAGGKKQFALSAVEILLGEGYVETKPGRSGYAVYTSVKPYRQTDDPLSDQHVKLGLVNFRNAFSSK